MQPKDVASENWEEQMEESGLKTKRAMDCKTSDVSSSRENPI